MNVNHVVGKEIKQQKVEKHLNVIQSKMCVSFELVISSLYLTWILNFARYFLNYTSLLFPRDDRISLRDIPSWASGVVYLINKVLVTCEFRFGLHSISSLIMAFVLSVKHVLKMKHQTRKWESMIMITKDDDDPGFKTSKNQGLLPTSLDFHL